MGVVEGNVVAIVRGQIAGGVRPTLSADDYCSRAMGEPGMPSIAATDGGEH